MLNKKLKKDLALVYKSAYRGFTQLSFFLEAASIEKSGTHLRILLRIQANSKLHSKQLHE